MPTKPYYLGFTSQPHEIQAELTVRGALPPWLRGTLIRNGPGQFEVGRTPIPHWFDGLAQLHRFSFGDGRVQYSNRFIRSQSYQRDNAEGKIHFRGFAVDPCRSLFQKAMALFSSEQGNNTVVNVTRLGEHYLAMTEFPLPMAFDPDTLETLGVYGYDDDVKAQIATAHPHYDPQRGFGINQMTHISLSSAYQFYAITDKARRLIASLPVQQPAYVHSFAVTARTIVLAEFSLRLTSALALAFGDQPFIRNFRYDPQRDSRFLVVDKDSGALLADIPADPFFAFHHINAYEEGDRIVLDICAYDDARLIDALYMRELLEGSDYPPVGQFRRYSLPLKGGRASCEILSDEAIELPRIHYGYNGLPYRYAYGASTQAGSGDFLNQLVKVDTQARTTRVWREEGCYPGEAVFVPDPQGAAEDEGVLLAVVLDSRSARSFLLVLDARDLHELARAEVPQHIPFGFHGQYWGKMS
jgi:carotenoid cleavage dioxygenase-like enzyme